MVEPPRSVSVVSVVPLNDLHVQLDFDDGVSRAVDVTPYVQGPQFKQIRLSEKFFKTAHVESGAVVWDNGVMLDADLLRYGPPKPEKPEKPKAAKPSKPVKHIAKPKAKAKPTKAKTKVPAKKTTKAVKPAKKAKPTAKPKPKPKAAKPAKKKAAKKKK